MIRRLVAGFLLAVTCACTATAQSLPAEAWSAYRTKFVDVSGRVIDTANGGISHSEGQGYGMLLAYLAGDRGSFERIWSFTRTELLIRDDGLAAWRWDPAASPNVTDINSASDGDLLIAYALALAGRAWNEPAYLASAGRLARALGASVVKREAGRLVLLPGPTGFSARERRDGPVLNLSYWVFEALPVMAGLAPDTDWSELSISGLKLIAAARIGPARLPPDWISVPANGPPVPAAGFAPVFGYNSLRIVLYLLRADIRDAGILDVFRKSWIAENAGSPAIVDVTTGQVLSKLEDPGYRMLGAVLACALDGTAIPDDLRRFEPTLYYPSTLYLLGLS
ncbi:MAG: glycosyl hydrolase family 8, partial [Xanthobacteraceae bacterium]